MANVTGNLITLKSSAKPIAATKAGLNVLLSRNGLREMASGVTPNTAEAQPFLTGKTLYIVGGVAAVLIIGILIVLFKK